MGNSLFSFVQCTLIEDDYTITRYKYKKKYTKKPEINYELEKKRRISFSNLDVKKKNQYFWNSTNETWECFF